MSIAVVCGCGQKYQVDDVRAGQSFRCKLCGKTSVVPYPPSAPYAVFLSYSAKDKGTAEAICSRLEVRGIRCWMAPRDITPGAEWGEAILEGLARCRVMALVFSQHSNDSAQVRREVERAVHKGLPIIPFRIEDLPPSRSLEYFLSSCHWLDAFKPPLDSHLQRLEEVVRQMLGMPPVLPGTAPAAKVSTPSPPPMPPLPTAVVPLQVALPEVSPRRTAGGVLITCLMTLVVLAAIGTIGWLGFDLFGERLLSALQDKPGDANVEPGANDPGNNSPPGENGTTPATDTPTEPATPAPEPGASALPLTGPKPADPPLVPAGAEGKRYAVIVGVESYDPEELNTLSFAVDDAEALGAELTKLGFDVTLMTEKNARPQLRPNSADKIQRALENRAAGLAPPDALVFAFLGHGVQFQSDQAAKSRELYFCPEDARLADRGSLLSLERVCKVLDSSAAGHKLILVDACRNDPLPDQKSRSAEVQLEAVGRTIRTVPNGMLALFSCSDGETSREYPELGHGVFTHHVLKYLRGEAEAAWYPDRQLSVTGLSNYVSRETKDYVWRQSSKDQIPTPYGQVAPWSLGALASASPRQPQVANSSPAPAPLSPMPAPMPPPTTVSSTIPPAPSIKPAPTPATPAPAKAKLVKTAAFLEDFKTVKLGSLPKDWVGDECIAVMTGSMLPPRLEASEAGQHVVNTSPVVIGDLFYLLIGLELGYNQPLKISLEGASGGRDLGWVIDPSQYVTTLALPDGEPRSVGEVIVKKPGYIRLERDGDVFRTFVNASLADARRLPGFGNFEAIKLEIAGGQGAADSNTRIYGIQVAPIDPAAIKTESPVPASGATQSWVKEDFRATKIGDLPTGWKGDDCIGVIKGGKAGARIEIGAEGKHGLTCPGAAIRGDFYLETEFDLGFGQTLVLTLLPEGGSPPLVLSAAGSQYVTPVTLADAGSKDAGSSVVRNRSKLRLEREGTTYRVYVNGEVTHARPLAGYGDFSGAAFQFDGGQAGAETRTHLYSLDVGPFAAP